MTITDNKNLLALDVGSKRIGVASASLVTKLPQPLTTIDNTADSIESLKAIIAQQPVAAIVIGLPRNLRGEDTEQTRLVKQYGKEVASATGLPIYWQDEALTSKQAEEELRSRNVRYNKGQVDALAATYILNDFLAEHREAELQ